MRVVMVGMRMRVRRAPGVTLLPRGGGVRTDHPLAPLVICHPGPAAGIHILRPIDGFFSRYLFSRRERCARDRDSPLSFLFRSLRKIGHYEYDRLYLEVD